MIFVKIIQYYQDEQIKHYQCSQHNIRNKINKCKILKIFDIYLLDPQSTSCVQFYVLLTSFIVKYQSPPVEHLNKVMNAEWKFQKLVYWVIVSPDRTSEKIKTPNILYIYNINTISAKIFSRLGIDITIVSNTF